MVILAGFDSLKDWQRRYFEWLKKSGKEAFLVEYPTMVHAFYIFPHLPESADLVAKVKDFVEEVINGFDETDLHRSWDRVSSIRNSESRNTRLENMSWRIWNLARKKKQVL